jgi:phosphoribosylamine--glycine ligase
MKNKKKGGMGAYSPSRLESVVLSNKIIDKIIKPTLIGLRELKTEFKGFLYVGLMIVNGEPYLIEYNVRMGDPECQTILPKLKTDFYEIVEACVNKKLNTINIEWFNDKSICIVLCSKGYPDKFKNEIEIKNLKKMNLKENEFIFHAGTKFFNNQVLSNGGRVLNSLDLITKFKTLPPFDKTWLLKNLVPA